MTPDIAPASARKPSDVLEAAADLIEPEGAWTQFHMARTAIGRAIGPLEAPAVCFCASGAICRVCQGDDEAWWGAIDYLAPVAGGFIPDWNDRPGRTQAEVVTALRKAAALARSEGQ